MARHNFSNIRELYEKLKTERAEYVPMWEEIAKYAGIQVDPTQLYEKTGGGKASRLDDMVDDPTAALSINQAGDYLQGVVWGTGDDAFSLEPSQYVKEKVDPSLVKEYFQFATERSLGEMNHSSAGLNTAMKPYFYDQVAFGTSGIGSFKNHNYLDGQENNALVFRNYGIDSIAIDEGKNNLVETVFVAYRWRVNRIVQEFAFTDKQLDGAKLKKLPKAVTDAYTTNNINKEFTVIQAVYPREDYHPKLKGKRGTKYKGDWFLDEDAKSSEGVFFTEDYRTMPIPICRAIKIRNEIYGRSSGSLLLSSIKSVNYMFSKAIEVIEKMASIPLGTWNGALFGDSVLDTSADGLTVFNEAVTPTGRDPVFPLIDVGNPEPLVAFLIPYLNEKITTGFKVDALLDFSSAKEMTATESMQRYAIRGRSLSGMLQQQKTEQFEPLIYRSVSNLEDMGVLGVNPHDQKDIAAQMKKLGKPEQIIPDAVLQCIAEGKPWFTIKFNNELEKLTRTEALERIMQALNGLAMISSLFPAILEGVNWYDLWRDINEFLGTDYAVSEEEFKEKMRVAAEMQKQQMALQMGGQASDMQKNVSQSEKNRADAKQL